MEVCANVVVNATGAWADELRGHIRQKPRLRPLRGSHLVFPFRRLPLTRALSFLHPRDGRPVFALPWEGAVLFGTTDVDHGAPLQTDPSISSAEVEYLFAGLQAVFPELRLTPQDVLSTYAGLRPVVNTGKADPSRESREHAIWDEDGLLTVSGGKLTTFRPMARDAFRTVRRHLGHIPFEPDRPVLEVFPPKTEAPFTGLGMSATQALRLLARYGVQSVSAFTAAASADLESIAGTPYIWAELRQAARAEGVVHLDDLLLRRIRLGLLLPNGGLDLLPGIRSIVQPELGWDDARWDREAGDYTELWKRAYRLN